MSRNYSRNDVEIDRVDERRGTYVSRDGGRRYDDRLSREEIDIRRGNGPAPAVRERDVNVREVSVNRGPEYLREDYGRSSAGPMVLRAREREDIEYVPRPRRRSPTPEPPKPEKEEIIIRRDERSESRGPPARPREREVSREREEIIIRRDDREREREPRRPPPREPSREREEIIIRRDERDDRSHRPPPRREASREREEIIIRRDGYEEDAASRRSHRPPPGRGDYETSREEIIIRRDEREDDRPSRVGSRRYDDDVLAFDRPKSHERARSGARSSSSHSQEEIIIRRDEREGRNGDRERQEIIIRRSSRSRSRSPSPAQSIRTTGRSAGPGVPPTIYAPPIHQEVITHHRHIDHGYEVALAPRPISRPPSPPSPPVPPARDHSSERIEIRRSENRNGRTYDEDIIIDRNDGARSVPPPTRDRDYYPPARREPSPMPPGYRPGWEDRAVAEEAEYYNDRALARGYPGEAYHGSTRDWGLVDIPPGTRRVKMDGAGGGSQEITWQRYNGNRRSKFLPDSDVDAGYGSELARPAPDPAGGIGPRYGRQRDPRDGLWTEVTKDLVIKEAIQEMGYEYEETDEFFYIFKYMSYEDMARLVGLSEDIRKDRHKRINEIRWENQVAPLPAIEASRDRLAIEGASGSASPRDRGWNREDERYIEREVIYRGGRPPPPLDWRR